MIFSFSSVDAVRKLQGSQRDGLRQMVDRHCWTSHKVQFNCSERGKTFCREIIKLNPLQIYTAKLHPHSTDGCCITAAVQKQINLDLTVKPQRKNKHQENTVRAYLFIIQLLSISFSLSFSFIVCLFFHVFLSLP